MDEQELENLRDKYVGYTVRNERGTVAKVLDVTEDGSLSVRTRGNRAKWSLDEVSEMVS